MRFGMELEALRAAALPDSSQKSFLSPCPDDLDLNASKQNIGNIPSAFTTQSSLITFHSACSSRFVGLRSQVDRLEQVPDISRQISTLSAHAIAEVTNQMRSIMETVGASLKRSGAEFPYSRPSQNISSNDAFATSAYKLNPYKSTFTTTTVEPGANLAYKEGVLGGLSRELERFHEFLQNTFLDESPYPIETSNRSVNCVSSHRDHSSTTLGPSIEPFFRLGDPGEVLSCPAGVTSSLRSLESRLGRVEAMLHEIHAESRLNQGDMLMINPVITTVHGHQIFTGICQDHPFTQEIYPDAIADLNNLPDT
ncbi:hypothetical protein B0H34DRAFT_294615 [Crassisporium funariophilum]|nr:hypothetical protein B0H34DRAFT_294615 [Crassisporium funariophilum]